MGLIFGPVPKPRTFEGSAISTASLCRLLLDDPCVRLVGHLREHEKIISTKAGTRLPFVAVAIQSVERYVIPRAALTLVSPDCRFHTSNPQLPDGFLLCLFRHAKPHFFPAHLEGTRECRAVYHTSGQSSRGGDALTAASTPQPLKGQASAGCGQFSVGFSALSIIKTSIG